MITLAPQYTRREYRWTAFKATQVKKAFAIQYDEDDEKYMAYGYDGPEAHLCFIYKNNVPQEVIDSGYSQEQNDLDLADFNTNYKSGANKSIIQLSQVQAMPPIGSKTITVNGSLKRLFARFTGIQEDVVAGSNIIDFVIPYSWVKIIGLEVINSSALDTADLKIYDNALGTFSGIPNALLNQYSYTLNLPKDYYIKTSQFDADVYQSMILRFNYISVDAKRIGLNILMNEVMT